MDSMNPQQVGREAHRAQANRGELVERIARAIPQDGRVEPLKGLRLHRSSSPTESVHGMSGFAFCVIAQGSKEVLLGDDRYQYDPAHYLLATAELPVLSQVIEASPERPYLSLRLELDPTLVGSVMVEAGHVSPRSHADVRAINVNPLDASLLDAVVRLARLVGTPAQAPFLLPLITREIVYQLLIGEQGHRLRHIAVQGGHTHRIARAIDRLRKEFDRPFRIEDMTRLTQNQALAEDVVQDALVVVWRSAERFRGEGRVIAWLLGIVHHTAMKALRHPHEPISELMTETLISTAPLPEEQVAVFPYAHTDNRWHFGRRQNAARLSTGCARAANQHASQPR